MLNSCECKHPPLVNDVIQVIWLLFQQHRNQIPFLRLTVSQSKIENALFSLKETRVSKRNNNFYI